MQKSKSSATVGGISAVEYFSLAVHYAKERGLRSIPVPMDIATSVLEQLHNPPQESLGDHRDYHIPSMTPPPLEVTSVSFAEEQKRTRPLRQLTATEAERRYLKDAGRNWHRGM